MLSYGIDETVKDDAAAALGDTFDDQDPVRELSQVKVVARIALLEQGERHMVDTLHRKEQMKRLLELTVRAKSMKAKLKMVHEQRDVITQIASRCSVTAKASKTAPLTRAQQEPY